MLRPLLEQGAAQFAGDFYRVNLELAAPGERPACPVLISALAPQMLRLAGELADGTVTWMAGPRAVGQHIAPRIRRAADRGGRPAPRVCVGLPAAVTDDEPAARRRAAESYQRYGELVNYRRVLDIEGVESPAEVAVIGNEASLQRQLAAFAEAGATDFVANIFDLPGEPESAQRTYNALKSLAGQI